MLMLGFFLLIILLYFDANIFINNKNILELLILGL